jgi:hypothetical protein
MEMLQKIIDRFGQRVLRREPIETGFGLAQLCGRQPGLNESSGSLGINRFRFLLALSHSGLILAFAANPYTLPVHVAVD